MAINFLQVHLGKYKKKSTQSAANIILPCLLAKSLVAVVLLF